MKKMVAVSRFFDKYIGLLFCRALSLFPRKKDSAVISESPRKILVLKFWEGGVIVMGAPYFKALKRRFPDSRITFLTLNINTEIASMVGFADEMIGVEVTRGFFIFLREILTVVLKLRREHFDLLLDLEFLSRSSAVLSYLIKPGLSAGFYSELQWRGDIHDLNVVFDPGKHVTSNYAAFFSGLGIVPGAHDTPALQYSMEGPGALTGEEYVVVNCDRNGLIPERNWPAESINDVLSRIPRELKLKTVLISSAGSQDEGIVCPAGAADLRGKLSMRQLAGLLKHCALFVTHDSGPMHIAAAMGAKVVAMFGPETPAAYGPSGEGHRVLYAGLPCSPCVDLFDGKKVDCVRDRNLCMRLITADMVLEAVAAVLTRHPVPQK